MSATARLLRADLLKLATARTSLLVVGATALVTAALVVVAIDDRSAAQLAGEQGVRGVLTVGGGVSCLLALALGIVGMAGEYRHATIGQALLAAPARWPVVLAKLLSHAAAGALLGLVALAVTFAIGLPRLAGRDAGVSLGDGLVWWIVFGTIAASGLFAAIGVGLAALLRDEALALAAGLGWALFVDGLVLSLAPAIGRFLPGGAAASLMRSDADDLLPAGAGALVLLAYALAAGAAGTLAVRRRDLA